MAKNRRSARAVNQRKRQQRLIIGVVALVAIVIGGIFVVANRQTAESGYYKHVSPVELERVVKGNEPVLVYFHSPT